MPREIWNEGRVVGLSAYELYVKQHLAEDPDTPVATEREWLASSLGMGSSMILKFPNTTSNQTDYDDEYIDVPLPQGSKLAAANSIVATFFDGDITNTNMIDDYWAKRVDNYGTGIRNSYDPSSGSVYRLKTTKLSDMLDELGYEFVRYNDISPDEWGNPPTYIQDNDGIRYICLGKQCGYSVGTEIELNQNTGNIKIIPNELFIVRNGDVDFSYKYLRFIAQHEIWKPHQLLWDNTVIHIDADMSVYHNHGVEQFGEGIYLRIIDEIYTEVAYSEADRYIDGEIHTDDIDEIPTYPTGMTSMSPGDLLDPNLKLTRDRLSDYLKIEDGIVIQPGTWSECEFNPPASDFEVNLKERPVIRFRVRGKITNNPYILLTGFTVRYVLCGTLGQDTATVTTSPQDGDFLGPAIFPWCNKVLFTVPDQYVTLFEKNYLNRYITSSADDDSYRINNDTPVIDMLQRNGNERSITYYYENDNVEDESLYKHNVGIHGDASYAKSNTKLDYHVADYSSLGSGQSVFVVYRKEQGLPPALYGTFVNSIGETKAYPIDSVAPGSIKMFHSIGDKGTMGGILSYYEKTYPGSNGIYKDYNNSILYTLDDRTINEGNNAGSQIPTTVPVANVNHFWMDAYVGNDTYDYIQDPKDDGVNISYNKIDAGRNSVTSLPFGNPVYATDEDGDHYENYVMSTKNSSVLEPAEHSDEDFINWYDMIRALAGNRKIDLLGKTLRELKNSLSDANISFVTYKLNLLKSTTTGGSDSQGSVGSSWKGPGPNDYYYGSSGHKNKHNWTNNSDWVYPQNNDVKYYNLMKSVKMDIYGYTQNYNDGTKEDIHDITHNYLATVTAVVNDSGGDIQHVKLNTTSGYFTHNYNVDSISGFSTSDDSVSTSSTAKINVKENKSDIGVNSWIQALRLNDPHNVISVIKLLREIGPKKFLTNSTSTPKTENTPYVLDHDFIDYIGPWKENTYDDYDAVCRVQFIESTGTVKLKSVSDSGILPDEIIEGVDNKPKTGTHTVYLVASYAIGGYTSSKVLVDIFYDKSDGKYKMNVTAIIPDMDKEISAITFTGRCVTYGSQHVGEVHGDVTVRFDVKKLWSQAYKWFGFDWDSVDPSTVQGPRGRNVYGVDSYIGGYIQGKADGDSYWEDLYGMISVTGGISFDYKGIDNTQFKSSGYIELPGIFYFDLQDS